MSGLVCYSGSWGVILSRLGPHEHISLPSHLTSATFVYLSVIIEDLCHGCSLSLRKALLADEGLLMLLFLRVSWLDW
jgi:hypothetical protein